MRPPTPTPPTVSATPTAYMLGRVTLNPIKHIDPWGSIIMPAVALFSGWPLLGWAKPCPVTLRNFRKVKKYDIITTLAGPASNLAMALIALILLLALKHTLGHDAVYAAMDITNAAYSNMVDTTQLPTLFPLAVLLYYGILTNVLLFVFNLIPIPPLDGSRVLRYYLSPAVEKVYDQIGFFGINHSLLCRRTLHPTHLLHAVAGRLRRRADRPLRRAFLYD